MGSASNSTQWPASRIKWGACLLLIQAAGCAHSGGSLPDLSYTVLSDAPVRASAAPEPVSESPVLPPQAAPPANRSTVTASSFYETTRDSARLIRFVRDGSESDDRPVLQAPVLQAAEYPVTEATEQALQPESPASESPMPNSLSPDGADSDNDWATELPSRSIRVVRTARPAAGDAQAATERLPAPTDDVAPQSTNPPPIPALERSEKACPIDLPTALRLAGGNNLQIALAIERVNEARARFVGAKALWLPSLNGGVGYNQHNGRIQATSGEILEVRRGSVFAGGGAAVGNFPLTGGSGGPLRLAVDLSLTDALFEPLAARQVVRAAGANRASTFNDVLLQAAVAYEELVRAHGQLAIAEETVTNAKELDRLTNARWKSGVGLPADAHRAQAELALRRRQVFQAQERVGLASAELVLLLRLDPSVIVYADEDRPLPLCLVPKELPLPELIAQGVASRPEVGQALAMVGETSARVRQEYWRPLLPNLHVGFSAGTFAGGRGSTIATDGSRSDLDVLAIWQLRNLGIGTASLRRQTESRHRQAHLAAAYVRDQVAAEVASAYHRVRSRLQQIEEARRRVEAAAKALPLNFKGILGGQLRAIEAQQAIGALDAASRGYLDAVIDYNQAQFGLLRAIGTPPDFDVVAGQLETDPGDHDAVETIR